MASKQPVCPVLTVLPNFWLLKSEPSAFSWSQLQYDGVTLWDGVRNYEARNYLRAMKIDDLGLFYHSITDKKIMGIIRVVATAQPDPSAHGKNWSVVKVVPLTPFPHPITLATIKEHPALQKMVLLKQSRLSVCPVTPDEWAVLLDLGGHRPL